MDFRLVLLATSLTAISATAVRGSRQLVECSSLPTNQYCHLVDRQSQMALNIANGATYPGASAVQWEPLADSHDNWRFEDAGDGHYHLIAEHSNLSLVAEGNYWGANVVQGSQRDAWCMVDQGSGFYKVQHRSSALYLDTVDSSHGANVVLKSGSDSGNQQWSLNCFKDTAEHSTCESIPTDQYCHIVAQHSQEALNVQYGSDSEGSAIVQYWESDDDHFSWKMVPSGNNNFKIVNKKSGLGLHAQGNNKGDAIVQKSAGDDWCFINQNDGYYEIKSSTSGLALDIYKVQTDPETPAVLWEWGDGQDNRKFRLNCNHGETSGTHHSVQHDAPQSLPEGCEGSLGSCSLIDIKSGEGKILTPSGKDNYSVAESDKYTVRCDVNGVVNQVDFFYEGYHRQEWGAPYYMSYASADWTEPVDVLGTCGSTKFTVSGKMWSTSNCFEATYELEAPCSA